MSPIVMSGMSDTSKGSVSGPKSLLWPGGYDVTGYVQNLADGRVYLHAEGAEAEVEAFTDQLAESLDGHIRGEEIKTFTGLRTCTDFSIRR